MQVATIRRDVAAALGERIIVYQPAADGRRPGGRSTGAAAVGLALQGSRAPGRGLQLDIERLFNQKQRFSTPVVFSMASVTEGILKLVFKTAVECVRVTTFGKYGYQQIQVRWAFCVLLACG